MVCVGLWLVILARTQFEARDEVRREGAKTRKPRIGKDREKEIFDCISPLTRERN